LSIPQYIFRKARQQLPGLKHYNSLLFYVNSILESFTGFESRDGCSRNNYLLTILRIFTFTFFTSTCFKSTKSYYLYFVTISNYLFNSFQSSGDSFLNVFFG